MEDASGNHVYGYDAVDRLTSATNSVQPNESYAYDGVGNRTSSHLSGSYGYQPFNKLTNTATASYTYDSNGNLTSRTDATGSTILTWHTENQLMQVALPTGLTVNYKYDALGRRIQRTTNAGANERYVYDSHDVLLDLNADGSVATSYLNGPGIDNHLRQTSATTGVSYFLPDHLGSTAALTDSSGSIVEQLAYDSFGNTSVSTRTRYSYTGRERDPHTGLMYYRARWHDPIPGRFESEDPIGFEGNDINLYVYVHNRPTDFIDPSGTQVRAGERWRGEEGDSRSLADMIRRLPQPGPGFYTDMHRRRIDGHHRFPGEPNSPMRHCVVSCESAREWGQWGPRMMGIGNEGQGVLLDIQRIFRRRPTGAFQFTDLINNERGFSCHLRVNSGCCQTCEDCCSGRCGGSPKPSPPPPRLTAWDRR